MVCWSKSASPRPTTIHSQFTDTVVADFHTDTTASEFEPTTFLLGGCCATREPAFFFNQSMQLWSCQTIVLHPTCTDKCTRPLLSSQFSQTGRGGERQLTNDTNESGFLCCLCFLEYINSKIDSHRVFQEAVQSVFSKKSI